MTMTSSRESLSDLLKRVEEAKGPGLMLSREVAKAFGWHRVEPRFARNKHGAWIAPEDFLGTQSDGRPILDSLRGTSLYREPPHFTASLEAALALAARALPKAALIMGLRQTPETRPWARVDTWRSEDATGANLALALLAALLRALLSQDQ